MNRTNRATIRRALAMLPETCRYHGHRIDRPSQRSGGLPACCDTGVPAWRRREALLILDREEATEQL